MKRSLLLLCVLTGLLFAVPANASAAFLFVEVTPSITDVCRPTPDTYRHKISFKAKITRSGVAKPSKVRVGYKVVDASTAAVLQSGVTNLTRRNKYKSKSKAIVAQAGQTLNYVMNLRYKSGRQTRKAKTTSTLTIPSVESMDAANAATPSDPPFPACV